MEGRSKIRFIESRIEIKDWVKELPSTADVRPAQCVCCGRAGAPLGEPLVIVGHGTRRRSLDGPCGHDDPAGTTTDVDVRRYRCRACKAVLSVAPRGVLRARRFSAFAIGYALALFGLVGLTVIGVRELVADWSPQPHTANLDWAALRRWARAVRDGRLFPGAPRARQGATLRKVAQRVAMALSARAPPEHRDLSEALRAAYGGLSLSPMSTAA